MTLLILPSQGRIDSSSLLGVFVFLRLVREFYLICAALFFIDHHAKMVLVFSLGERSK